MKSGRLIIYILREARQPSTSAGTSAKQAKSASESSQQDLQSEVMHEEVMELRYIAPKQQPCEHCPKLKAEIQRLRSAFCKSKKRNKRKQEEIRHLRSQLQEYLEVQVYLCFLPIIETS